MIPIEYNNYMWHKQNRTNEIEKRARKAEKGREKDRDWESEKDREKDNEREREDLAAHIFCLIQITV